MKGKDKLFVTKREMELERIAEDLALLLDGPEIEIGVNFDQLTVCVKSHGRVLWEGSTDHEYRKGEGPQRARFLLSWLHQAAVAYRRNQAGRRTQEGKKAAS